MAMVAPRGFVMRLPARWMLCLSSLFNSAAWADGLFGIAVTFLGCDAS